MEMVLRLLAEYAEAQRWPEVSQITVSHIEQYLVFLRERPRWFGKRGDQKVPVSDSSVESHYRRLKTFFRWLVERGHISENPLDLIKHPKFEERVVPTVSERELLALLELVNPKHVRTEAEKFRAYRNRAIIWLLIDTPIRRDELGSLRVEDVDLDAAMVKVMGKGRRERFMPLGETSLTALWDYLQVRRSRLPQLWLGDDGHPLVSLAIYILLKRLGERAGVSNLHTHRFRHTFATTYLRNGGPERYLRIVGGWRRIPETYFRTLGVEDVARAHRQLSPGDRLAEQLREHGHTKAKIPRL
jgi:site-specific recombinase XerD